MVAGALQPPVNWPHEMAVASATDDTNGLLELEADPGLQSERLKSTVADATEIISTRIVRGLKPPG